MLEWQPRSEVDQLMTVRSLVYIECLFNSRAMHALLHTLRVLLLLLLLLLHYEAHVQVLTLEFWIMGERLTESPSSSISIVSKSRSLGLHFIDFIDENWFIGGEVIIVIKFMFKQVSIRTNGCIITSNRWSSLLPLFLRHRVLHENWVHLIHVVLVHVHIVLRRLHSLHTMDIHSLIWKRVNGVIHL